MVVVVVGVVVVVVVVGGVAIVVVVASTPSCPTVIVMVMESDPVNPVLSVAVNVTLWTPSSKKVMVGSAPVAVLVVEGPRVVHE